MVVWCTCTSIWWKNIFLVTTTCSHSTRSVHVLVLRENRWKKTIPPRVYLYFYLLMHACTIICTSTCNIIYLKGATRKETRPGVPWLIPPSVERTLKLASHFHQFTWQHCSSTAVHTCTSPACTCTHLRPFLQNFVQPFAGHFHSQETRRIGRKRSNHCGSQSFVKSSDAFFF